ncbi:MAG TPA: metal-dependent hydrolase [Gemmatimonadales bacterium]
MDNLCHSLVGAALAETGLRRRTRYATAALVLGANFPDIDIAAGFSEHGLGFRRGITHGILALIVLPFVLTGLLLVWNRLATRSSPLETSSTELLKLSALAILTHPILDWMNVYGMRWLMPFDGTWYYGDSLFIVDPWLLLMLGAAWIGGRRARLPDQGLRRASGERFARRMVALSVAYVVGMMALTRWGQAVAARELDRESPGPRQLMVAPPFLESWRREVTVDAGTGYRFGSIDWVPRPTLELSQDAVAKQLELLDGLPRTVALEDLLDWARFPFAETDGRMVHVDDARYARGGRSFAGIVVLLVEDGRR